MKILLSLLLLAGCGVMSAQALFIQPQQVPVERLLKSAGSYLAGHPGSAEAQYTLARIHYLAFARGSESVPAIREADDDGKPVIPGDSLIDFDLYEARQARADELALRDIGERGPKVPPERASAFAEARGKRARQLEEHNWHPKGSLGQAEMIAHATAAVAGFHEAQRLDPKNGLYVLGLASLTEQFADWAAEQKLTALPSELQGLNHANARSSYLAAFRLAFPNESKLDTLDTTGIAGLVSYEAGNAYVRLAERDHTKLKPQDEKSVSEVKAGLGKLRKIPLGAITPMVFSLHPSAHLAPLLAPQTTVDFDLRGYGPRERWSWVQPSTGFLVWDPSARGQITSGQQLLGGYTFQVFRRTGYEALAALDTDGDGWLTGPELHGLRVWFDTNSDGHSAPGEVHDLWEYGITGLAVEATDQDGPHPTNARGLRLYDGRTLPTWDWMAEPIAASPGADQMSMPTTQAKR